MGEGGGRGTCAAYKHVQHALHSKHKKAAQSDTVADLLQVELHDWENQTRVGEYRYVRVMDESDGYRILAGSASGDAGDPFHSVAYTSRLQSMRFSTFDVDNDMNARSNCARTFTSGWWFNSCFSVNLNGQCPVKYVTLVLLLLF